MVWGGNYGKSLLEPMAWVSQNYCDVGLVVSANPSAEQVAQYALLGADQRWLDYTVVGDTELIGDRELATAEIFDALLG